jgi:penicillin-binding protein 1B
VPAILSVLPSRAKACNGQAIIKTQAKKKPKTLWEKLFGN